jgi:hypothetical protein
VIKFRGYLGGHYPNIGTNLVTHIIGVFGQNGTRFGIKTTCLASKKGTLVTFLCPIHSGGTNLGHRHPGGKSRKAFREGRIRDFDLQGSSTDDTRTYQIRLDYLSPCQLLRQVFRLIVALLRLPIPLDSILWVPAVMGKNVIFLNAVLYFLPKYYFFETFMDGCLVS